VIEYGEYGVRKQIINDNPNVAHIPLTFRLFANDIDLAAGGRQAVVTPIDVEGSAIAIEEFTKRGFVECIEVVGLASNVDGDFPDIQNGARCIAPDLIGMGKSDKPDIGYTFEEHYDYLEKFIEKLDLKNVTLVIHDWGSGLGFHYANLHRDNIKGIAFMEALIKPLEWKDMPKDQVIPFKMLRTPFIGWLMVSVGNMFVKKLLPEMIVRKLPKEKFDYYKKPYPTVASRKPIRVWPEQIPINGKPENVFKLMSAYAEWLKETEIPKLCLYSNPGAIIRKEGVAYVKRNFKNTDMVDIGEGLHFVQEDNPHGIGKAISEWIKERD